MIVAVAEAILSGGITLFGSFPVPLGSLLMRLSDDLTIIVADTEIVLGRGISLLSSFPVPPHSLLMGLSDALTISREHSRISVSLGSEDVLGRNMQSSKSIVLIGVFKAVLVLCPHIIVHTEVRYGPEREVMVSIKEWVEKETEEEKGNLASYTVVKVIGHGGFSEVRLVEKRGHRYAMKVPLGVGSISNGTMTDNGDTFANPSEDSSRQFKQEARVWARITVEAGKAAVGLVDFGVDPIPWMVMELAEEDLSKAMTEGKVTIFTVIELLRSLQRIHDLGIVHRDIKPENILLVGGTWRFSDFGLSKSIGSVSMSGSMKGTPEYMAPEQFSPKKLGPPDERTDIWQMGILALRVISGKSPYVSTDPLELMSEVCGEGPDLDAVPQKYRPVLGKALARDRKDRYASATEFANALESLAKRMMMCSSCGNRQQYGMGYCLRCGEELWKVPEKMRLECHHCHRGFDFADGMTSCPFCGKDIFRTCPKCGAKQSWDLETCTACGSELDEKVSRIKGLTTELVAAIGDGDIASGEKLIAELRSIDPRNPSIHDLQDQLDDVKGFISKNRKEFEELFGARKFYGALGAASKLRHYPKMIEADHAMRRDIADAESRVKAADLYCKKATEADSKLARKAQYVAAVGICPDHPVARRILKEDPPIGPSDATGFSRDQSFVIKFEPSSDPDVTYCIFREENRLPRVDDDTCPLAEIPATVYVDKTMEPGVEYYYSIYSKRWGILSKEATHLGPVMAVADVDKVSIEPIEGGLRIKYEKPRRAARVRIWRADGTKSSNIELPIGDATVYDDIGLVEGKKYYYLIVAEYDVRGKVERSEGAVFSGTTQKNETEQSKGTACCTFTPDLPKPVRDMVIKWGKADNSYYAKWGTSSEVSLYTSSEKPPYSGKRMSLDELRSLMTPIEPIDVFTDGMKFSLPEGLHYVCPVIEHGDTAICGTSLLVAHVKPFRKVETYLSGGICHLRMKWPDGAIAALAMVSDGPCGLDDLEAPSVDITLEQYMKNGEMEVPVGSPGRTHISLYAIYRDAHGQKFPSRAVQIDLKSQLRSRLDHESMTPENRFLRDSSGAIENGSDRERLSMLQMMATRASANSDADA